MSPLELPVPFQPTPLASPGEETLPSFLGSLHCVHLPVLSRYQGLQDEGGSSSSFSTTAEPPNPLILQLL